MDVRDKSAEQKAPGPPPRKILCCGGPRVMGQAQGFELATEIAALRHDLVRLEPFRLAQPFWLPYPVYRWVAERRAKEHLTRALRGNDPAMQRRLEGIDCRISRHTCRGSDRPGLAGAGVSVNQADET